MCFSMIESDIYKEAGVDIKAGNDAVDRMKRHVRKTFRSEVLSDLGGFAGLFSLNKSKFEEPVLVSGTDGVGTKLKIAFAMERHDTIGIDAVAMCVNDILVQGAEPLFFLDYIACDRIYPEKIEAIIKGIAEGCLKSGCSLIGGETAEMPGMYASSEYDIAGFAVGIVDKRKIIDGSTIKEGDLVIGLPSSGVHSNGFSLVRYLLLERQGYSLKEEIEGLGCLGEELLKPTKIYVKTILELLKKIEIKGMVHVTGGGFIENIPRVLPKDLNVQIELGSWPILPIFELIQREGNICFFEMFRTFNMGIGFTLVVSKTQAELAMRELSNLGEEAYLIGKVVKGEAKVTFKGTRF